jgi:hypothetical protein
VKLRERLIRTGGEEQIAVEIVDIRKPRVLYEERLKGLPAGVMIFLHQQDSRMANGRE